VTKERLLITGASGFLGKRITRMAVAEGKWEIYALTSGRKSVSFPKDVKIICIDLLDKIQCKKMMESIRPEYIIHLAWKQSSNKDADTNIQWLEVSLQLMYLFSLCGGRRFLFAGSRMEYHGSGNRIENDFAIESIPLYGTCKESFENVALCFLRGRGVEFVSLRYFILYGKYDHSFSAIPSAILSFLSGKQFVCKNPNNILDYVYVDDAAEATVKVLANNFCGIVNIATGLPVVLSDTFSKIAEILNCQSLLHFENSGVSGTIMVGDTNILNNKIGYSCKTDFNDGLKRTITWYRDHLHDF
jgi:nucleoside-diphosphate-sugar epimerase